MLELRRPIHDGSLILSRNSFRVFAFVTVSMLVSATLLKAQFQAKVDYPVTAGAYAVAVGDFNRGGKPDLAVTSGFGGHAVSVLLGNGDGTFQTDLIYMVGFNPIFVVVADFNGDGKLDLAVVDDGIAGGNGSVSILLGNGDGTFQAKVDYDAGVRPSWAAVADFNGDGKPDLVVTHEVWSRVFLGRGDGSFQPGIDYSSGGGVNAVAVADFNGDGIPDLVTANGTEANGFGASVLLGVGDGTFQFPADYRTGGSPIAIATGDFSADGKPDLVVPLINTGFPANTLSVLLGKGDGTLLTSSPYVTGFLPFFVTVANLDGDGKEDLAVANQCGTDSSCLSNGSISILLGNGDGTFQGQVQYQTGMTPTSLAIADFNADGKPDIAVANSRSNTVSIFLNAAVSFAHFPTSTSITSSGSPAAFRQSVNFSATLTPGFSGAPTGTITFKDGRSTLRAVPLSGNHASLTASGLVVGKHFITANYGGDAIFTSSTSPGLAQIVPGSLGLGIPVGGTTSATVQAGATASYTLSIGGQGIGGAASITCTGAPTGATCTVPGSLIVDSNTPSPFTVTVSTTSRTLAASMSRGPLLLVAISSLAMIALALMSHRSVPSRAASRATRMLSLTSSLFLCSQALPARSLKG